MQVGVISEIKDKENRVALTPEGAKALTEALLQNPVTAAAYETVEDERGALPLLEPMSAVAGHMAATIGS